MEERWAEADKIGAVKVQDIPLPWKHKTGLTVIRIEYPPDRPRVVDVVFSDGTKYAETKDSRYVLDGDAWGYPDIPGYWE
jgi:hypothetical protein